MSLSGLVKSGIQEEAPSKISKPIIGSMVNGELCFFTSTSIKYEAKFKVCFTAHPSVNQLALRYGLQGFRTTAFLRICSQGT